MDKYCCERMYTNRRAFYFKKHCAGGIRLNHLICDDNGNFTEKNVIEEINYCPFCGKDLGTGT